QVKEDIATATGEFCSKEAVTFAQPSRIFSFDMSPFLSVSDRDIKNKNSDQQGPYIGSSFAFFRPDRITSPDNAQTEHRPPPDEEDSTTKEDSSKKIDYVDLTLNSSPLSAPKTDQSLDVDHPTQNRPRIETSQAPSSGFSLGSAHCLSDPSGASTAVSSNAASLLDPSPPPVSIQPSVSSVDLDDAEMLRLGRPEGSFKTPQQVTPPSSTRPSTQQSPKHAANPKKQTPKKDSIPDVGHVAKLLRSYSVDIRNAHTRQCIYALKSTKPTETRVKTGIDFFAGVKLDPEEQEEKGKTMSIKTRQFFRGGRKDQAKFSHYLPVLVKTNKDAVPKYRFHHTEIVKNVLSPNSMLKFVPVLRDFEPHEEPAYAAWLNKLAMMDQESGFKTMGSREERCSRTIRKERTATLSLFLDSWLKRLGINNCNRTTLIRYMGASSDSNDAITPQQKTSLANLHSDDSMVASPRALKAASVFTDAFNQVFDRDAPKGRGIPLKDVLKLDRSVDEIVDTKKTAKGGQEDNEKVDYLESWIETHTVMGCLICYSNSCEHGDYSIENHKRNFSMDCIAVVLGKSQLEGCGYGLFTAEDIAQDEFVIEYTGELIVADEGVRREARRGEAFCEGKSTSYVFSLLDHEGIWVDAAIYGNLSRYINHAVENANVQPAILYVNGEYRIRFTATRNIKTGDELFFNYGENFPNLTEKMIKENKKEGGAEDAVTAVTAPAKRGRGRRRAGAPKGLDKSTTQKISKAKIAKTVRTGARKEAPKLAADDYEILADANDAADVHAVHDPTRKRKRAARSDDEETEYHPSAESENPEVRGAEKPRRRKNRGRSVGSRAQSDSEPASPEPSPSRVKRGGRAVSRPGPGPGPKGRAAAENWEIGTPPPKKRRGRPPKNPRPPSPGVESRSEPERVENEIRANPTVSQSHQVEGGTISVDLSQPPRSARGRKITGLSFPKPAGNGEMELDNDEPEIDVTPTRSMGRRRKTISAQATPRSGRTSASQVRRATATAINDSDEEPLSPMPSRLRHRQLRQRMISRGNDSESSFKMQEADSDSEDDDDDDVPPLSRSSRNRKLPARFRSSDEDS
ncbi:Histone-lysine N-methyltransferase EZH2, partial [Colletotrichum chlorophyti]